MKPTLDCNQRPAKARCVAALRKGPGDLYQVVVECRDEAEQRELFERMRQEGRKVRLLVL